MPSPCSSSPAEMTTSISPLLSGKGLPEFQAISPELVSQDIPVLLEQLDRAFSELEKSLESALASQSRLSWDAVMQPLQAIGERLRWSWGVVSHHNGVCNSPELRDAHAAQQPDVVRRWPAAVASPDPRTASWARRG